MRALVCPSAQLEHFSLKNSIKGKQMPHSSFYSEPTENELLQFGRAGVFGMVPIKSAIAQFTRRAVPPQNYWEYQNLSNFDQGLVYPVLTDTKDENCGALPKRKILKRTVTVRTSSMYYTSHALQRLYERNRCKQLSSNELFFEENAWFDKLSEISDEHTEETGNMRRTDLIVPFQGGAFLGFTFKNIGFVSEKYLIRPTRKSITLRNQGKKSIASFAALTFIKESQMTRAQREVCESVDRRDFESAAQTLQGRVNKHHEFDPFKVTGIFLRPL